VSGTSDSGYWSQVTEQELPKGLQKIKIEKFEIFTAVIMMNLFPWHIAPWAIGKYLP
jgi:hypothetical protein